MFEELRQIDTEAVEELARIQEEREVLEQRLTRLEDERQQVNEVVYERVKGDYETRLGELEEKAQPLEEQARAEHDKLRAMGDGMREDLERIRLEKEELELRHRLGELEGGAYEERVGECEKRLEGRQGEMRDVDELEQRFAAAFRSAEERATPAQDSFLDGLPPLRETVPAEDEAAADEAAADEAAADEAAADEAAENEAAENEAAEDEAAADEAGEETGDFQEVRTTATAPVPALSPSSDEPPASEATVLLQGPRLEIHRDDGNEEMRLGNAAIHIGRAVKNEVRFLSTSVSREHASIALGDEGWVIRDLGSGNGTLVNGERVAGDRPLDDGDTIQVGSEVLVFRDR